MKLAIIDPVGLKAGMNCYDLALLQALYENEVGPYSFSNFFDTSYCSVNQFNLFLFEKKNIASTLYNYISAHFHALRICKKENVKWIVFHVFSTSAKDYFSFLMFRIFRIKTIAIIHDVESLTNADVPYFKKQIYKLSSTLVVHNKTSRDVLNEALNEAEKNKVKIIPHGNYIPFVSKTNGKNFFPNMPIFDPNYKYLLFFGQIKRVKGLDVLLRAIPLLPSNYKLIIAGRPQKDNVEYYQKIIDDLKISERVIQMIRYISDEERNYLFTKCDALVLPYRKIFQSGVLLLAMSYGLPVVVSDLPANREVICSGENGMIFKDGDAQDLSCKIRELFANENKFQAMKKTAFETARDKHSWGEIAKQYKAIISES